MLAGTATSMGLLEIYLGRKIAMIGSFCAVNLHVFLLKVFLESPILQEMQIRFSIKINVNARTWFARFTNQDSDLKQPV